MTTKNSSNFFSGGVERAVREYDKKVIHEQKGLVDDDGCFVPYLEVDEKAREQALKSLGSEGGD